MSLKKKKAELLRRLIATVDDMDRNLRAPDAPQTPDTDDYEQGDAQTLRDAVQEAINDTESYLDELQAHLSELEELAELEEEIEALEGEEAAE